MKVMGLDLSLKSTGICLIEGSESENLFIKTELFSQPKVSSVKDKILRLLAISEKINLLIAADKPDLIVIEAPAKNQVWQAAAIGEVHGVVKTQIYLSSGMIPLIKEATEMRKSVVGKIERKTITVIDSKGNEKKKVSYGEIDGSRGKKKQATVKDIIEIRLRERGLHFSSQDEMDAYVAARYGWGTLSAS